jgi:signal transducing adaptor molecule
MLVAMWAEDFANDPTLGIMEECYESLKAKSTAVVSLSDPSLC